jgi:hypothetical protein
LKWQHRSKIPPNARRVPSYSFSTQKVNVQWKFKQIVAVYGDVMNWQDVTRWCHEFSKGRTDVHDEQRRGRPSLIADDLKKTEGEICANWCGKIRELNHIISSV